MNHLRKFIWKFVCIFKCHLICCNILISDFYKYYTAYRQAYCNITAGAAFCLGLRFAGTQNEEANTLLDQIFKLFLNSNTIYLTECAGKPTVESCLMLVLLATSLVRIF